MATYQQTLNAYLKRDGNTESGLADAINRSQPAVNRYRKGERFPDADTARAIETATGGAVPFSIWHAEFLGKSGIAA